MADRIIALFPPHNVYVEVFGGGASVLLTKPTSQLEVYNDLDALLVNFFTVLRDRPLDLVPLLELTPYSRLEWERARELVDDETDPVERARLFYVIAAGSFAGFAAKDNGSAGRGWGGERLGRMHLSRAASTANRVDHIWRFVERLRLVQIDHLSWRLCLDRYDDPDALFYLDPPYVPETRRSGGYRHELTKEDHEELVDRVLGLKGIAIISGYDSPLYEPLTGGGFTRHEWGVWSTAARGNKNQPRDRRTEVVWASPRAAAPNLFTHANEAAA